MRKMRRNVKGMTLAEIMVIISTIVVLAMILVTSVSAFHKETGVTVTIEDKWVKNSGNDGKYLVSTDKGVYSIEDSYLSGRFNSSDVYADVKIGTTYVIETRGCRIPFLSMYKNIVAMEVADTLVETEVETEVEVTTENVTDSAEYAEYLRLKEKYEN